LKSADFFDVESHPEISFTSTKVVPVDENKFQITGDLTMRGVTKPVTFDAVLNGIVDDPWGNTKAGFTATTTIDRQDYGVSWSKTLDAGGLVVSNDVNITVELQLVKVKAEG
jgi:polyisoprenoid-binding protein YceI